MTVHANNYFPKKIYAFRSVTIEFLDDRQDPPFIAFDHQRDDQFEMARPIMIDLNNHIASRIKLHFYFDSHWLLISEITFDSSVVPPSPSSPPTIQSPSIDFWLYVIICLCTIALTFILTIIISLLRRTFRQHSKMKRQYFTPIHHHTDTSVSTTSSDIDIGPMHHRYATIRSMHPYLRGTNDRLTPSISPHYARLMSTTSLIRPPSVTQQVHVEGICGNSALSTERLFQFDLNAIQFIPNHQIHVKRRVDNRRQILGDGEVMVTTNAQSHTLTSRFHLSDVPGRAADQSLTHANHHSTAPTQRLRTLKVNTLNSRLALFYSSPLEYPSSTKSAC